MLNDICFLGHSHKVSVSKKHAGKDKLVPALCSPEQSPQAARYGDIKERKYGSPVNICPSVSCLLSASWGNGRNIITFLG